MRHSDSKRFRSILDMGGGEGAQNSNERSVINFERRKTICDECGYLWDRRGRFLALQGTGRFR